MARPMVRWGRLFSSAGVSICVRPLRLSITRSTKRRGHSAPGEKCLKRGVKKVFNSIRLGNKLQKDPING